MKKFSSRTGSAILVVLGMTAFLLVSAIAFSAYMRYSRLPSSYLRRSSSTRLLVKAAMARAIDAVDIAVNNNPHPGVGDNTIIREPYVRNRIHNYWYHRVLMGTNGFNRTSMDQSTVSPLCLEALAYIPPPLVNEARFYSRVSPTARWHSLDYDTGRYSFLALDVSDYFDINRMMADVPRSSAPNRRITLAYLFENERHTSAGSGAEAWDTFMENFRTIDEDTLKVTYGSKMPLVSMADYNLQLGRKGSIASFKSPFYDYLTSSGGAGFYNTTSEAEEDFFRRQTFVTDAWFPKLDKRNSSGEGADDRDDGIERYDLNDGKYQPFTMEFLEAERPALSDVVLGKRLQADGTMKWLEHLSGLGCAALYDYLDPDHVPISLAVPTTERAPMICGLETTFPGAKFGVRKVFEPESGKEEDGVISTVGDTERTVRMTVKYRVDSSKITPGFMGGVVKSLVVFPFAHKDTSDGSFVLDGRFSMFFSSQPMTLRTGEQNDVLHLMTPMIANTALDPKTGLMNVKLQDQGVSFPAKITSEDQAVKEIESRLNAQAMGPYFAQNGNELLSVTYEWKQTHPMTGGVMDKMTWIPKFAEVFAAGGEYITAAHCGIPALLSNGTVDPQFTDANIVKIVQGGNGNGPDLRLNAAVWMRLKDKNGKIVDMVPACLSDDKLQNNVNDPDPRMAIVGKQEFAGQPFPIFRMDTGVQFKLSISSLEDMLAGDTEVKMAPEAAIVADPRFNYAPEHWFELPGKLTKENWLQSNATGGNGRDHDIFMATSDAGYMQSPYEVAHLTRFTNLIKYGNSVSAGNMGAPDGGNITSIPKSFGETRNNHLAWLTYDPIDDNADAFLDLPWTAAGNGFKVNPYSDSTNILMSVFANTPIDWKRASTNDVPNGESYYDMSVTDFNKRYAFNEYSDETKLDYRVLERIAGRFSDKVRSGVDWEDALADLGDWTSASADRLCGVELGDSDDLWDADRKFLYGFWNDCFAVKQQLYLVFVRAEPVMMGSGTAGQIPPQLGARAMALVWRDPNKAKEPDYPHQTRVLFYRQFE